MPTPHRMKNFHAASTAAVTRLDTLSISTGNATTGKRTTPTLELFDLTGPHTALPVPALAASLFAITGGNRTIHVVDPRTGVNSVLDASAPFNLRSLALGLPWQRLGEAGFDPDNAAIKRVLALTAQLLKMLLLGVQLLLQLLHLLC